MAPESGPETLAAIPADAGDNAPAALGRRDFLKWATTAAAVALVGAAASPAAETSAPRRGKAPLVGSKTAANLMTAFAGESQARNRYAFFAEQARREGYMQMADIFEETADNEREHANRLFSFMKGGAQEIAAGFPFGAVGDTAENLKAGADGEHFEWETMYPTFAKAAREEGFNEIADCMLNIAKAEKYHETRYLTLLKNIQEDLVFRKPEQVNWLCVKCGYVHSGTEAPGICPICLQSQGYYKIMAENY